MAFFNNLVSMGITVPHVSILTHVKHLAINPLAAHAHRVLVPRDCMDWCSIAPGDVVKISEDFGTETAFGEGYRRGDFRANTEDILTDDTPE